MQEETKLEFPAIGSRWFNDHRQKIYTVVGRTADCENPCESGSDEGWEVLYRSDDMPPGEHRHRKLESWYGINRHGKPRFTKID